MADPALPIVVPPTPSAIEANGAQIQAIFARAIRTNAQGLSMILGLVQASDPAAFWLAQGKNGSKLLAMFGAFVTLLETVAPSQITPAITTATANLKINTDGSVTYIPPAK